MDAQKITFNHDPETAASDIVRNDDDNCCCPCRLFYWYIAPLTCELCHTLKCLVFHPINFAVSVFLFTFDITMVSLGIGLIPLCCMGLPLLWISVEFIIAFSRLDLALHYYLVETKANVDPSKAFLITLSLYFTNVPLCCCYNEQRGNCMDLMIDRIKYLFTSIEIYKYISYHCLVKPIISWSLWSIMVIAVTNIALVGFPIWYLVNDTLFVRNRVVFGWNDDCKWSQDDNEGIICGEDYVWIINTFGRALGVGIIGLLVLPLTLRINNYFGYLNKVIAYKFYTIYYSRNMDEIRSSAPILSNQYRVQINSV